MQMEFEMSAKLLPTHKSCNCSNYFSQLALIWMSGLSSAESADSDLHE